MTENEIREIVTAMAEEHVKRHRAYLKTLGDDEKHAVVYMHVISTCIRRHKQWAASDFAVATDAVEVAIRG